MFTIHNATRGGYVVADEIINNDMKHIMSDYKKCINEEFKHRKISAIVLTEREAYDVYKQLKQKFAKK